MVPGLDLEQLDSFAEGVEDVDALSERLDGCGEGFADFAIDEVDYFGYGFVDFCVDEVHVSIYSVADWFYYI